MHEGQLFNFERLKEWLQRLKREIAYHDELKLLAAVFVVFVAVVAAYNLLQGAGSLSKDVTEKQESDAGSKKETTVPAKPAQIVVYVTGAVKNPGVYVLNEGSRLYELFQKTGLKPDAAVGYMNLAEKLSDSEMIYVPTVKEAEEYGYKEKLLGGGFGFSGSGAYSKEGKININHASVEELTKIPGIGPVTAQKIVEFREKNGPIRRPEDLLKIDGIGKKKLEKMKEFFVF